MKNKRFNWMMIFVGVLATMVISSCTKKIDDAYLNPNAAVIEPIETILPSVIGNFTYFYSSAGTGYGLQLDATLLGRYIQYFTTTTNSENYAEMGGTIASDNTGSVWAAVYYGQGQNLNQIVNWGTQQKKWDYVGVAWAIRAWGWLELTNQYGDAILKQAFNTSLSQFKYDTQPEFYDSCRAICFRSLAYLNMTGDSVSQTNLAKGDAYCNGGDVNKWKKFVYGVLARSYIDISAKDTFRLNGFADSAIKYANLAMTTNADNTTIKFAGGVGGTPSATLNYFGPYRANLGAYRQTAYIANLLTGNNLTSPFKNVADPRAWYLLRENASGTFTGFTPWLGSSGVPAATYPYNYWGNTTATSTVAPAVDTSRYIWQNGAPGGMEFPIMTASEMQFIIAEAALRKGDNATALTAYKNGISLNFDMLRDKYPQHIPAANLISDNNGLNLKANYLASPGVVPAASALSLSHIMLQKYIALYGWGVQQTWTDMRKFHYTDPDPVTGNQVYADFTPPSGIYLVSTNLGQLVYRCRPRYNSEYLYDVPELTRIGAENTNYNTYQCWFSIK